MTPELVSQSRVSDEDVFGLYNGDTRDLDAVLANFPEELLEEGFVDTVITSPPYGDLKDYDFDKDVQVGQNQEYAEYLQELRDIFGNIYDITKESGTMWVVANTFSKGDHLYQLPFDIADICQRINQPQYCPDCAADRTTVPLWAQASIDTSECPNCGFTPESQDGWLLQDVLIWNKQRALPYTSGKRVRNVFEYILCFSKAPDFTFKLDRIREVDPTRFKRWWINYPERYHPRGKLPGNIWNITTPTQGSWGSGAVDHPAPFPRELISRILRLTTEESNVVFDPFAGSGSVLAQAEAMGRRPFGIEYNKDYCDAYETVRSEFLNSWEQEQDNETTLANRQRHLEQLIAGLRQTRFGREMLRATAKQYDRDHASDLPVAYLVHICDAVRNVSKTGYPFIDARYYVVTDDYHTEMVDELNSKIEATLATDLCSGYGIDHNVEVIDLGVFQERIQADEFDWLDQQLFFYEEGHHNDYLTAASPHSLSTAVFGDSGFDRDSVKSSKYPSMFSNRGLSVPHPTQYSDPLVFDQDFLRLEYGTVNEELMTIEIPSA